jgi:predicted DCC family thiol-disulfide oxidoreductase YuxK
MPPDRRFTMFYDGLCPLCSREVNFLRKRNGENLLTLIDTAAVDFKAEQWGLPEVPDRIIHGALPDGRLVSGVEVFRRAYAAVGLGWMLAPTGWPGLRWIADRAYVIFARYRKSLGRLMNRKSCNTERCG